MALGNYFREATTGSPKPEAYNAFVLAKKRYCLRIRKRSQHHLLGW